MFAQHFVQDPHRIDGGEDAHDFPVLLLDEDRAVLLLRHLADDAIE